MQIATKLAKKELTRGLLLFQRIIFLKPLKKTILLYQKQEALLRASRTHSKGVFFIIA